MKLLLSTALLVHQCEAFLIHSVRGGDTTTRLNGINEWRDQAAPDTKYAPDDGRRDEQRSSAGGGASSPPPNAPMPPPASILLPVLPFPFSDALLPGQRTQLNLYERRFHDLFRDVVDDHCGILGMGLIAGNGMITTMPLCEIESFTRFGAIENWVDEGNGMGNGSIFVTIRAVGRAKIVESDGLLEEGPYMKARVVELVDEDASLEGSGSGLKERRGGGNGNVGGKKLIGESSPLEVASMVAGNIENLLVSLASMEHKLKAAEEGKDDGGTKKYSIDASGEISEIVGGGGEVKHGEDEVMNRRIGKYALHAFPD
jgi:hypothetical protein